MASTATSNGSCKTWPEELRTLSAADVDALDALVVGSGVAARATELRHWLHAHPELGFQEVLTGAKLVEVLVDAGLEESAVTSMAETCKVVDIAGTGPADPSGPRCVALRTDMDGLPIVEAPADDDLAYVSSHKGRMHACGHDGHMASLMAAALVLLDESNGVRGRMPSNYTVRLLLQAAEERPGGAEPMVAAGCMDGVDEVYGFHNWPGAPVGTILVADKEMMAHVSELDIEIVGDGGGHGSQPHDWVDVVLVAAKVVEGLHSIVARDVHSAETAVISVCSIHGGEAYNVMPNSVKLKATIRDLSPAVFELICERIHTITNCTAAAYGATARIEIRSLYPAVINHPPNAQLIRSLATSILGSPDAVSSAGLPTLAAEDFSYFLQERPGAFYFIAGGDPDPAVETPGLHTASYNYNDAVTPIAAKMHLATIRASLGLANLFTG